MDEMYVAALGWSATATTIVRKEAATTTCAKFTDGIYTVSQLLATGFVGTVENSQTRSRMRVCRVHGRHAGERQPLMKLALDRRTKTSRKKVIANGDGR